MKKISTVIMICVLCFSTFSVFAPKANASNSLVGYWKFDEGSGSIAHDSSGNGNDGTVHGATWVTGISGSALSFDGSSNYVSIPDSSSLDISGNQISIEFWMKPTVNLPDISDNRIIFDKGNAYTAAILGTADPTFHGTCYAGLPFFVHMPSTTNSWASGTSYHIAITYDGSNMRIYVNGQVENTVPTTGNVQSSGYPLSIGSYCMGTQNFFKGILDDFAIYDYARTAEEIQSDYAQGGAPASDLLSLPAAPYGWQYSDSSHNTLMVNPLAGHLVSASEQSISASPGQTVSVSVTYQVFAQMPPNNPNEIDQLFFVESWTTGWPPQGYTIPLYNGIPGLSPGVTQTNTISFTVPSVSGTYYLWLCFEAQYSMQDAVNQRTQSMTGLPAHIKVVVAPSAAPVGYWKFDEGSGNIAHDSSGNGNDGAVVGASWTNGVSSGALQFDGIDDYVGVPSSPSICVTGNQVSVQLWMKPAFTLDAATLLQKNMLDKGDEYGFQMDQTSSGRIWFFVWLLGAPWQGVLTTTNRWEANAWYLLTGTYDGNSLKVYVNGVLENSRTLPGALYTSSFPLAIGSYCLGTMTFFNGAIDEVKIYNYARTAEEIQQDYSVNALGLVGYWKFDEGSGSIAHDSSGNGNDGTLINNPQWVDGVRGKALKFDGVDDSVYVADSPSLDITGTQMSVEYWMEFPGGWQAGMPKPVDIYVKGDAWVGSMNSATGKHRFNFAYFPNPYPETNKNSWDANTWYFIADVYDGSYIRMYVNGVLDVAAACSGAITVTNEHFEIGGGYGWPWFFNGTIDELAIYDYARTAGEIQNDYNSVLPPIGQKPVAILHLDNTVHNIGADVWFYGDQSYDPDGGEITSYIFDFDDQTPNVQVYWPQIGTTHQYSAPGEYWSRMKVIDDEGTESDWTTGELTILPAPGFPTAILTVYPNPQKLGSPVTFDASQSNDPNGISEYGFEFGDGTPIMWTGNSIVTHAYSLVGEYYVRVCVSDTTGLETWSMKQRITVRTEEPPQPTPLRVSIQSDPPVRLGTIPFAVTFTAIPSGGKGSYSISWLIESNVGGTWSSTQNPLAFNFKYSDTYIVKAIVTCSGTSEAANAQTTIIATGTLCEAKFTLWSGIVQAGTNNPLVSLEYDNIQNLGYFTVSGSSISLKTDVRVSFNGAGSLPDWLFDLIGISAPWYSIKVSDAAGTVDAVPLVQLKAGTATPIDVTLPLGTPTTIDMSYMYNFSASPTSKRALCADLVSCVFAALSLDIGSQSIMRTVFEAAVIHLEETKGAELLGLPLMTIPDQWSLIQTVIDDVFTPDYLISLAAAIGGDVARSLMTAALRMKIAVATVLSYLGIFLGAIYRGDLWDEYYVSQATPMLYVCVDPPEIANALLSTSDGTVGYDNGTWENESALSGFYHSEILNNTYGFGLPITATGYCADLTLSSSSGNAIPYRILVNWMNKTSVFQGEVAGEAQTFGIEVFETGEMTTVAWKYIFKDAKRGTTLKISTDDKYFQFVAPNKDFGIKQDLKMKVFNHVIAICYTDSQMSLLAAADGNVGFCSAIARDKQTCKTYWLIEYPPTYTLTVCCLDANGKAVSSASIYLNGWYKGQTDSNGNLAITNVLAGEYTVTAKKCGYEDTSSTITVTGEATLTLTMTRQTYTLIVFCKDWKGKAVSGASVYISGNYQGVTNSSGKLAITNITAGTYTVTAKKSGYKDTSVSVTVTGDKTITITMN